MIKVISHVDNFVNYVCECNTVGKCLIRPMGDNKILVFDLKCPNCWETERVTLVRYGSEKEKEELLNNIDEADLCWTLVLQNDVVEDKGC